MVATINVYSAVEFAIGSISGPAIGYTAVRDEGQTVTFMLNGSTLTPPTGSALRLTQTATGFQLVDSEDNVEVYNSSGQLLSVTSRSGVSEVLTYDSSNRLATITDSFGYELTLAYNAANQLASVTDPTALTVQYGYDSQGRLSTVTNLDGTTRSYAYENASFPMLLTGVTDESSTRYSTWGYNSLGQASSSYEAGGANAMALTYNNNGSVTTTDALGAVRTFTFAMIGNGNQNLVTGISGSRCPTCTESAATTYDSAGWVSSRTDYDGNLTCYANDPSRGLELVRVEGFAPGSTCPGNLAAYTPPAGTAQRKISTTWSAAFRLPTLIVEPTRTTSLGYDGSGNLLTKTVTDTTANPSVSRTWTYTYNSYGQVLTAKAPRTDINSTATYTYYNCTSGAQCGQLQTVTDALGHVWTYNTYNAYGQPLTITDPNGVLTSLTYDDRQRLASSSTTGETTSFSYYPTGLLKTVTLADNGTFSYTYDGAHRLTQIADGAGNKIVYTPDAMGNQTAESTYDPAGSLHATHSRVINALNEVYQEINSAGTPAVTTTFAYDSNGNTTTINAPLSRNTSKIYDALNRLQQVTDPGNGVATYAYDADDHVVSVTDPRNLVTSYSYDGFGDLTSRVSPDAGTTANTYDSAGNLLTSTDGRGAISTYSYDALNRVTSAAYSLGGITDQHVTFTYDAGSNGIGRLTGAADANHSLSWAYDARGRVISKTQSLTGGVPRTVSYVYTAGDLTGLTTPSGQVIGYGYNGNHQITSISVNGVTLLSGVTYEPFGSVSGWSWANGTAFIRAYDGDGHTTQIASGGETDSYQYDSAERVISDTNAANGDFSWTYGYDALDRLTSADSPVWQGTWTYDADGNRLTEGGTYPFTLTISSSSNQIAATSGYSPGQLSYDAAGNITGASQAGTGTYNAAGRGSSLSAYGFTLQFTYDAMGWRIYKTSPLGNEQFVYDEARHLLGEYDDSGNLIEEMVYLGDVPVATLRPNGSGGIAVYYAHPDYLNTIRKITRPSDNALVWRAGSALQPFYNSTPDQNPSGQGTFVSNLAFPGQYLDQETGLLYNGARYYSASLGSYFESDPLGLTGRSYSTYAYVDGNPISYIDPLGLAGIPTPPPGVPYPPANIPGGPWTWSQNPQNPRGGQFIGPPPPGGGQRTSCTYTPKNPGIPRPYWKVYVPGQAPQRYDLSGNPQTIDQAHGNSSDPIPFRFPWTVAGFAAWALTYSQPAW